MTGNGGSIVAGPMDVFDSGRLAVFADPAGAVFGVWQPKEHKGFGVVDRPGGMCWFELLTRDADRARTFYRDGLRLGQRQPSRTAASEYTEWKLEGESFSGMMRMGEDFPPEVPAHWMVYVQVEDCDATAAKARELGGEVHVPPTSIPPGRFALLRDPQGGVFSVIALTAGSRRWSAPGSRRRSAGPARAPGRPERGQLAGGVATLAMAADNSPTMAGRCSIDACLETAIRPRNSVVHGTWSPTACAP